MSVRRDGSRLCLEGVCGLDDAEALVGHLQTDAVEVDLGAVESLHAAVLQVLLASRPSISRLPPDPILSAVLKGGKLSVT